MRAGARKAEVPASEQAVRGELSVVWQAEARMWRRVCICTYAALWPAQNRRRPSADVRGEGHGLTAQHLSGEARGYLWCAAVALCEACGGWRARGQRRITRALLARRASRWKAMPHWVEGHALLGGRPLGTAESTATNQPGHEEDGLCDSVP